MSSTDASRRAFLRQSGALGLAGMAPWAMNLAAMADAAAAGASSSSDYKALVCVFLQGGNDHANTLIPVDAGSYATYQSMRGALALPLGDLATTTLSPLLGNAGSRQMALAPALSPLMPLFDANRMAVLLNIGPLVKPISKADFQSAFLGSQTAKAKLPPKLFSHNDQQSVWQSYEAEGGTKGSPTGWGGLIADAGYQPTNPNHALTCINVAGNTVYLAGQTVGQYMVNTTGPKPLLAVTGADLFGSVGAKTAFRTLVTTENPDVHRMAKEHALIMKRAMDTNEVLLTQLGSTAGQTIAPLALAPDASNHLAVQLNTVARIMSVQQALGVSRQVFFVALGGFDHHDNLSSDHPVKLAQVAQALSRFDADLGTLGLRNQVTTFTASDFGRTMNSNGDGSDHGWGSYHFVMGGSVNGGRYFGELPDVKVDGTGQHDIGQGRLLPTMAVDQLAQSLAGWMGVTNGAQLDLIAPHRAQFSGTTLSGLFKT